MPSESPGWRKLAQLVAHHVLGDEQRYVTPAIVDGYCKSQHIGHYNRGPGPRTYDRFAAAAARRIYFLRELGVHIRPLLN